MRFAPSKRLTAMVSLTALSLMLAGCGGGGGVNSTPAPSTPAPTPTPTPAPTPMPTPTPTPTPTPPATKIVGKPAVSTTFAATANLAAVDYDVGRAQSASGRSEEHTSELQSLMRISYAVFCLKTKNKPQ